MFELLVLILFGWIFWGALRLAFKVTWGFAKIAASILFVLALPVLIVCLLFAGGMVLLLPVALIALAWGILKACV
ncbi:MAG: hypothetical protein PUJ12_08200 [Oscillospiraceae bacterium]|nr:hypothetical protein [Oscillospiraceae bacterium]